VLQGMGNYPSAGAPGANEPPPPYRADPPPSYGRAGTFRADNLKSIVRSDYEHVLIIDRSGSMGAFNDCPGGLSRWDYALECSQAFVAKCVKRQGFPMKVIFFSSKIKLVENVNASDLPALWAENEPYGGTNLADAIRAVAEAHFRSAAAREKKKTIAVVITDGVPDNKKDVADAIIDATYRMEDDGELGFAIIQIGRDAAASQYLRWLDDGLQAFEPSEPGYAAHAELCRKVGVQLDRAAMFDIVDATPAESVDDKGGLDKVLDMAITD